MENVVVLYPMCSLVCVCTSYLSQNSRWAIFIALRLLFGVETQRNWEKYFKLYFTVILLFMRSADDLLIVFFFLSFLFSTFVCPTEIIAFSDRVEDFRKIGCEVIGCSTDSHFTHLAWINTERKQGGLGELNIPLLADKSMKIARDYEVLDEESGIPFRGLYIIDGKQTLRQITVNDLPVGRSVDETLRLVQAFQYTDVHGEVCPANWKPGSKTMKPDANKSKDYFNSVN